MHNKMNSNSSQRSTRLPDSVPDGQLVNRQWLSHRGYKSPEVDYYLRTGGLQAPIRGFYRRPGPELRWQSVLYSLQEMRFQLHVGGVTALAEQGFTHFVSLNQDRVIHLYGPEKLPVWLEDWHTIQSLPKTPFRFAIHQQTWLKNMPEDCFIQRSFGQWDWQLNYATAELAVLEILMELQTETDFLQMDRWFQSLATLSPTRLLTLLKRCPSVKAKRLFGWFAERHQHAWFNKLDWRKVDLGSGKRSLIKGGRFNNRWQLTVPRGLEGEVE